MSIKTELAQLIRDALAAAQRSGALPEHDPDEVAVERPQKAEHGDFASSLPLKLARPLRMAPMAIAQKLAERMPTSEAVERVTVAPPGFLNVRLKPSWLASQVDDVIAAGEAFGNIGLGEGTRVQVEFVSVNPTGPLHVGHARGAVIGSALADVLQAAGYDVEREYYINDAGSQMDRFNQSLYVRYLQALGRDAELPEGGYKGEYMAAFGKELAAEHGDRFAKMPQPDALRDIGKIGLEKMLGAIREDLELLRIRMDVWFSERSLFENGQYDEAMGILEKKGMLVEREGAKWFASTAVGEDKDNVVIRGNGSPTYFASDIAYHYDKFAKRGFDTVIDIWGADHQGHIARVKAAAAALGTDPDRLTILAVQIVTFKRRDEVVRLSKRSGDIITLRELVQEVGADACRFLFLSRSPDAQLEFDMELAKEQSADNPVYYVQYAHARIASILALAKERGIAFDDGDTSLLSHEAELALIRKIMELPDLVELMARKLEPHHLPHYAMELATAFHWFYGQCRVVSSEPGDLPLTKARLKLVDAARIGLSRSLRLMGMDAPDKM
ncbi:MAG: arginine--tRNA ligase [SAR202 cluster bacterium]|nr:arginine--tRNA ligase [SAR202 cluster bacterium]